MFLYIQSIYLPNPFLFQSIIYLWYIFFLTIIQGGYFREIVISIQSSDKDGDKKLKLLKNCSSYSTLSEKHPIL